MHLKNNRLRNYLSKSAIIYDAAQLEMHAINRDAQQWKELAEAFLIFCTLDTVSKGEF